jgi:hypothetical protein
VAIAKADGGEVRAVKPDLFQGLFLDGLAKGLAKAARRHDSALKPGEYAVAATLKGRISRGNRTWDLKYALSSDVTVGPPRDSSRGPGADRVLALCLEAVGASVRKKIRDALAEPHEPDKQKLDEARAILAGLTVTKSGSKPVVSSKAEVDLVSAREPG